MPQNFLACDREQELLLPPSLREWLPESHLAWFVLDAVEAFDLEPFFASYRRDGWGRAAHDPAMMLALLLYAYAVGERSSRRIERRCEDDVAFRVITANQVPDHATVARFRVRHERALADLFADVLGLCAQAGLVRLELIAVDGTKVGANASQHATRDYEQIAREILEEAADVDAREDEQFGERRGDELPPELATREGRQRWLRDARRRQDERRAQQARPVPRSRAERLLEARRRLEEDLDVERRANAEYEAYRARGVMKDGRRFGGPPKPYQPPDTPVGKINLTDPDSRNVKTPRGWVQGYNAQAACTEDQIVIAAEVTVDSPDFGHLEPMVKAIETDLAAAGVTVRPHVVVADAGYWHQAHREMSPISLAIVRPSRSPMPGIVTSSRARGSARASGRSSCSSGASRWSSTRTSATASAMERRHTSGIPRSISSCSASGSRSRLNARVTPNWLSTVRAVHRRGPQPHHVHASPESLLELAVGERRHVHPRDEIAARQLGQHLGVELVGLGRQRPDRLRLARVGDLHRPASGRQLVADPRGAAHHLQARDDLRAQAPDEHRQAIRVGRRPSLVDHRAGRRDRAPSRTTRRPIDSNVLRHEGTPLGRQRPRG